MFPKTRGFMGVNQTSQLWSTTNNKRANLKVVTKGAADNSLPNNTFALISSFGSDTVKCYVWSWFNNDPGSISYSRSYLSGGHLCSLGLDCYCWWGIGSTKQLLPIQRLCSPTKESFEKALLGRLRHLHALLKVQVLGRILRGRCSTW